MGFRRNQTPDSDEPTYLLEDFLLLARGESLCVERDMVSLEYERSERSDRSERGDDERPLLLLLRGGLAEPLWRRFLSTAGDKYLRWKKGKKKKIEVIIRNCAENALLLADELLLPVLPGGRVLLLLFLLQVFQPRLGLLLLLLLPLLLPFQFLFFFLLRKCDHEIFKLRLSRLTSTIKASTEVKLLLPFAAVCPCSAPPAPECSVRASWVVCRIPAHPGTS